jgi:hypothetical protein
VGILLRKLDRIQTWDLDDRASFPWLRAGEFQADPLSDLNTSGNTISVYEIDEDEENLTQVAGAISIGRGKYDRFDYVLFPESVVSDLGLRLVNTLGQTADAQVNQCHRDISDISAQRLVELVARIVRSQRRIDSVTRRDLIKSIIEGLNAGRIKHTDIKSLDKVHQWANKLGLQIPEE